MLLQLLALVVEADLVTFFSQAAIKAAAWDSMMVEKTEQMRIITMVRM